MSAATLAPFRNPSRGIPLSRPHPGWVASLLTLAALTGAGVVRADEATAKHARVEVVRDVAYYEGPDADPLSHRLDLYLPTGQPGFPVLVFVHGGAWQVGDKDQFGAYSALGRRLARHGIGMVSINYRLSPSVRHPEHVRDVARAFAWTRHNVAKYGGSPDELFIGGHSAGGHLAALLATDESYLKAEGLSRKDVRGVLPISGVYNVPVAPVLDKVFGKGSEGRKLASPITHVTEGTPPFRIFYADRELPGCEGACAEAFCKALCGKDCVADTVHAKGRNHVTILWNAATSDTDPVTTGIMHFIVSHTTLHRLGTGQGRPVDFLGTFIARSAAP